ncbi:MAG TPA: protein kinase [Polyangiales bacterium]|nr:protein kinase [Polyangiales bacterium]
MLRGRYSLDHEIGRGATGTVWAAQDTQLGRRVALKLLRDECTTDTDACLRFEREARTIAQLHSPNIVQIFDYGVEKQQPYIVMELLDGEDLESRLARYPRFPVALVASLIANVSKGLHAVHKAGILHRDLKPANVFLAREPRGELPKLLDFSVAASLPRPQELSANAYGAFTSVAGTPLYMSPEHYWGGALEPASDLWSLAVICYRMLTGRLPFEGASLIKLQKQICHVPHVPPSEHVPELGLQVDAFFERALAKPTTRRFADAGSFAHALLALSDSSDVPIRVLCLDDEVDMELLMRQKFRRQLREGRYELYFAQNGEEGLRELSRRPDIDLVMTDISMPQMDGLAFLARVPEVNPLVPVVVVSAYSDMVNIRAAMNRGAFDFLCKPIDFDDLERTIEKAASQSSMLRGALRSREENDILKLFAGVPRFEALRSLRALDRVLPEAYEATLVVARLRDRADSGCIPQVVFDTLNEELNRIVPEFTAHEGTVVRFGDHTVMVEYRGAAHASRAVEACIAAQRRIEHDAAIECWLACGIATGTVLSGALGSSEAGRMEQVVLGKPVQHAAWLSMRAQPGTVLVTPAIAERLNHVYACVECEWVPELAADEASALRVVTRHGSEAGPPQEAGPRAHDATPRTL